MSLIEGAARDAGRDPAQIGMEGLISWPAGGLSNLIEDIAKWSEAGATHVSINTMDAGF